MNSVTKTTLGTSVRLSTNFDDAYARTTQALKAEGFGVLTEIDVKETLKKKLDVNFHPYKILGACNPSLAYQALGAVPEIGLLLPCNVTISEAAEGVIEIGLVSPLSLLNIIENPVLKNVAEEAQARLDRVAVALQA